MQFKTFFNLHMTFIVNQSNLNLPDAESGKLSKLLVWNILVSWWNSPRWKLQRLSARDLLRVAVRYSYDSRMIVFNEELYFNQIETFMHSIFMHMSLVPKLFDLLINTTENIIHSNFFW